MFKLTCKAVKVEFPLWSLLMFIAWLIERITT